MLKPFKVIFLSTALVLSLSACNMSFGGPDSGEDADNQGPDSGDEIDTSQERQTPDSGDDEDNQGPDSGDDADNQGPDSGDEIDTSQEPTSPDSGEEEEVCPEPGCPDSGEEIDLSADLKSRAKGSCDRIADGSTCVEYLGSYWNKETAGLNCGGSFSLSPCPRPAVGGCHVGGATPSEIVTWHYNYGGDPYTPEVQPYAQMACDALPMANWINQ